VPVKRNQLSLWLGRLVIAYNSLENGLATTLMMELVELIGKDEPPKVAQLGYISPSMQRARDGGLRDMIMGAMSFKQKLDFLGALLLKRFSDNPEQQKYINSVIGLMYAADEFRNKMIHSVWEESYAEAEFSRVKVGTKGRRGLKVERHEADTMQIRKAIEVIECLEKICLLMLSKKDFAKQYPLDYDRMGKLLCPVPKIKVYPNIFLPLRNKAKTVE
jgi:hypothetical protein